MKPKMRLLGSGQYEGGMKDEALPSVRDAQDVFLFTIRKIAPEVLDDLSGEPLLWFRVSGLHFEEAAHQERLKHLSLYDRIREIMRLRYAHEWS